MNNYIRNLIEQGENQQLDFKFEITDSKKIARTLSAFSNSDGGKLLIGVKDNGNIAGIQSEEELHMIIGAADIYCSPPVKPELKTWKINGKIILEVSVEKVSNKPVYAMDDTGKWRAWVRVNDENFMANRILLKSWQRRRRKKGTLIKMTKNEKLLLDYLNKNQQISLSKLKKLAKVRVSQAELMLVNFLSLDIINIHYSNKGIYYTLKNPDKNNIL